MRQGPSYGPCFLGDLGLINSDRGEMNGRYSGLCVTGGHYNVAENEIGASVVTGAHDRFTCVDFEVFELGFE